MGGRLFGAAASAGRGPASLPSLWHFSGKLVAAFPHGHNLMSALENPTYRFCGFELDPAERRLSQAGNSISLTPKVFDTLVVLVRRAGHVMSKEELMQALWPRGYVDESNLTKHIWLIRRALGDGEQDSRFIETVPKVGYRFVAPVSTGPEPAPAALAAQAGLPPARGRLPAWSAAALLGGIVIIATLTWWWFATPKSSGTSFGARTRDGGAGGIQQSVA